MYIANTRSNLLQAHWEVVVLANITPVVFEILNSSYLDIKRKYFWYFSFSWERSKRRKDENEQKEIWETTTQRARYCVTWIELLLTEIIGWYKLIVWLNEVNNLIHHFFFDLDQSPHESMYYIWVCHFRNYQLGHTRAAPIFSLCVCKHSLLTFHAKSFANAYISYLWETFFKISVALR